MKISYLLRLFTILFLTATLFNACTKDEVLDMDDESYEQISLQEAGFTQADLDFLEQATKESQTETASTRNSCDVEICATFTGTGKYALSLPGGTTVQVNLFTQIVTINSATNGISTFPLVNNQLCQVLPFNGPVTAVVGFKGSGSVVISGTWPDGTQCDVFSAGVGNDNEISISDLITLDCDSPCVVGPVVCDVEICATFTGTGQYRLSLPGGTSVGVNLFTQTVTINSATNGFSTFPLVNNQLCQVLPFSGPITANVGFRGTGSVVISGTWPDGTQCDVFSAGVGTNALVSVTDQITLDCNAPCPPGSCNVEICATFTGTGEYRLSLPGGTTVGVNLFTQTVTINSATNGFSTFPLVNNQLCQVLPFNGPITANVGFRGTGSVIISGTWAGGIQCDVFSAGVGTNALVSVSDQITLDCDPPC